MDDYLIHEDEDDAPEECIRAFNGHMAGVDLLRWLALHAPGVEIPRPIVGALTGVPLGKYGAPEKAPASLWWGWVQ